jgi:hypothetical protein
MSFVTLRSARLCATFALDLPKRRASSPTSQLPPPTRLRPRLGNEPSQEAPEGLATRVRTWLLLYAGQPSWIVRAADRAANGGGW